MIQFVSVVTFLHSSIFIQIKLLLNKSKWNKNFDIVSTDDCTVPLKIKMALKYGNSSRLRPSSLQISQNFKGGDFRDQPRPVLWRNPFVRDSHYIESKQFLFCTSKQWLLTVFLLKKKKKKKNGDDTRSLNVFLPTKSLVRGRTDTSQWTPIAPIVTFRAVPSLVRRHLSL